MFDGFFCRVYSGFMPLIVGGSWWLIMGETIGFSRLTMVNSGFVGDYSG